MQKEILYIRQSLKGIYSDNEVKTLTRIILNEVFGINLLDIYIGKDINLSEKQKKELEDIITRLQNNEPIQYILEKALFYGLSLNVNPDVLIPRPETEELVEWIIKDNINSELKILDIGTGSGCIPIALSTQFTQAIIHAWDISEKALEIAKLNNEKQKANIRFGQIDILHYKPEEANFDLIISNPPYIAESEKAEMERNVLDWEPPTALFVPDQDPLLFYRVIAKLAIQMLSNKGKLYFEINQAYGHEVALLLKETGFSFVEIRKDLSSKDRMIKAQK